MLTSYVPSLYHLLIHHRFWTHFMKYDPEYHPDKKTTARCSLCGKDISVKQGTGGLKNHMKFKHPKENAILLELGDVPTGMKLFDAATVGTGTMSGGSKTSITIPARKKTKYELEAEKQTKEKHLMEMWSMTRREISELRKDLKNEEDADAIADMEQDLRQLRKRKAGYAKELGMNEEESV